MKSFWSLSAKCCFVIVLIQAWFLYDMHRQNAALSAVNEEYEAYLNDSEEKIAELQIQLAETEKKTVDGILKETNKAVVQGWESLLDKVEKELEKAREAVPELLELKPQENNDTRLTEPDSSELSIEQAPADSENQKNTEESSTDSQPDTPPVLIPGEVT